jgi:hypothetical protein
MSNLIENGGPAFPFAKEMETISGLQFSTGMSLRDWFAGQAMETEIRNHQKFTQYAAAYGEKQPPPKPKFTREQARYNFADAMLEARSKAKGGES